MTAKSADGDQFVQETKDTLAASSSTVTTSSSGRGTRALIRYGDEPAYTRTNEIERAKEEV